MKRVIAIAVFLPLLMYAQTTQLIVVTTENWNSNNGKLERYERVDDAWRQVGKEIDIKLGRNGLGWGRGLYPIPKRNAKYIKKEGDGRSPAGIFALKQAFGYAPFKTDYPYVVYKETDHCVDDANSRYYNKIVESTQIKKDYQSFEHMKFPKDYYKYGIVVDHNGIADGAESIPGAGSCIFLHIKDIPTAGCTVMSEAQIKEIIRWLDESKEPLLVQGTQRWKKRLMRAALEEKSKDKVEKLIGLAQSKLGQSYEPAAVGPDHFDCSGFVYYLHKEQGISIARSSIDQSKEGKKLSKAQLKRGDLVFFDTSQKGHVNHSGVYLGEGKFIHASSGKAYGVTISDMNGWYKDKFKWGIRKIRE